MKNIIAYSLCLVLISSTYAKRYGEITSSDKFSFLFV